RSGRAPGGQFGAASGLHQPGNHPPGGRQLRHHGRPAGPARQLAPDRRGRKIYPGAPTPRYAGRRCGAPRARRADAGDQPEGVHVIRMALWLLGALLLGGIVHLATVLLLPSLATQDAYARVSAIAPVNAVIPVPPPTPEKAVMPFMDPAFAI